MTNYTFCEESVILFSVLKPTIISGNMPTDRDLYVILYRIRRFEETVLENYPSGVFYGTTHTYSGQEANAVGVLSHLEQEDIVFSNHRCHGHFLAYGGDPRRLFAELMGRAAGVCGGRGGSQHLHWRNFYSNGIQGGIIPVATGMALAEKFKQTGAIVVVFLGDGTLGEGVLYESLNMASLWRVPILYVLENNRIAQTTPVELAVAGGILARFEAFGIQGVELNTSDIHEILPAAGELIEQVRGTLEPRALVLDTIRFGPHSKGDDTRDTSLVQRWRETRDPLRILAARIPAWLRIEVEAEIDIQIGEAYQDALADPYPEAGSVQDGVWGDVGGSG